MKVHLGYARAWDEFPLISKFGHIIDIGAGLHWQAVQGSQ